MPDFRKMTVQSLRELARKLLGPGHSKLTKSELVEALENAGPAGGKPKAAPAGKAAPGPAGAVGKAAARVKGAARRAAEATGKAVRDAGRSAAGAGKAVREGAVEAASKVKKGVLLGAAEGAATAAAPARARKAGKAATAAAAVAGAAVGAAVGTAAGVAAATGAVRGKRGPKRGRAEGTPDPEGFFVARVRGETAVRESPHPMAEPEPEGEETEYAEGMPAGARYDEGLGDLPWGYGDDAFVALPRDPRTLFLYWDHAQPTLAAGFEGLDHPRAQLWVFARVGGGWDRVRVVEFALESRGWYLHDLEPGRTYRAEIHAVDGSGRDRLVGRPSNEVVLPPVGPSPVVDDRFIRIPWDLPLGRLLGPGHSGGPFSEEARALLARLSDWSRFAGPTWGGSAGGMGGRPFSPTSSPSAPFGPRDEGER